MIVKTLYCLLNLTILLLHFWRIPESLGVIDSFKDPVVHIHLSLLVLLKDNLVFSCLFLYSSCQLCYPLFLLRNLCLLSFDDILVLLISILDLLVFNHDLLLKGVDADDLLVNLKLELNRLLLETVEFDFFKLVVCRELKLLCG